MKKKGKKVILFLVEGASDLTSLEFIDNVNADETIRFQITSGDITSKSGVSPQNCREEINKILLSFLVRSKLRKTDIIKIIHILDIDGVYIPEISIVEDKNVTKFLYTLNGIIAPSKEAVQKRNEAKKQILEKLLITSEINSIPYEMYYMSCNLEHVLHNKLVDMEEDEKKELANKFADRFYEKEIEFINFINRKDFKVLGDYKTTWNFIKEGLNSVNRYSNFWLFFETIKIKENNY
ncbi:hypothetical protein [Fusobacterium hwasookii]|uniref:hypothetical protein n=1 Tax=Fusobacterium hwasookii TaxID=1583098 RepID=UPI001C6F41CC|nr:hypothetical protein [Fusobacterium hwasookii]QYR55798.1 hypothetical protein JY400_04235 [Fusobacterium hwasookii]